MVIQTRHFDQRYFDLGSLSVGRTKSVRGDFDAYDGHFTTTSVKWWLDDSLTRMNTTVNKIKELIAKNKPDNPLGLALFFSDSENYGKVFSKGFTSMIDFKKSFSRNEKDIFPKIAKSKLNFCTRVTLEKSNELVLDIEFWEIKIDLETFSVEKSCFWSGPISEIKTLYDYPPTK